MTSTAGSRAPISDLVAGELRAHMGRQRKTVTELALVLGFKDRKSAQARYDGVKSMTLAELDLVTDWLQLDRSDLLAPDHTEAMAS